jgi:hypothetical protein
LRVFIVSPGVNVVFAEGCHGGKRSIEALHALPSWTRGSVAPFEESPKSASKRPPGVLKTALIRLRVNFVSELLKSVENLE